MFAYISCVSVCTLKEFIDINRFLHLSIEFFFKKVSLGAGHTTARRVRSEMSRSQNCRLVLHLSIEYFFKKVSCRSQQLHVEFEVEVRFEDVRKSGTFYEPVDSTFGFI